MSTWTSVHFHLLCALYWTGKNRAIMGLKSYLTILTLATLSSLWATSQVMLLKTCFQKPHSGEYDLKLLYSLAKYWKLMMTDKIVRLFKAINPQFSPKGLSEAYRSTGTKKMLKQIALEIYIRALLSGFCPAVDCSVSGELQVMKQQGRFKSHCHCICGEPSSWTLCAVWGLLHLAPLTGAHRDSLQYLLNTSRDQVRDVITQTFGVGMPSMVRKSKINTQQWIIPGQNNLI